MNLNFRDFAIFLDYDMVGILSRVFKGGGFTTEILENTISR